MCGIFFDIILLFLNSSAFLKMPSASVVESKACMILILGAGNTIFM